jgi:dolichol kinase
MSGAVTPSDRNADRWVLGLISFGLLAILLSIVWGLFLNPRTLPNWAENVLVSIATACALKLGDCLATLIALASGRQVERLGQSLAAAPSPGNQDVTVTNTASEPIPVETKP